MRKILIWILLLIVSLGMFAYASSNDLEVTDVIVVKRDPGNDLFGRLVIGGFLVIADIKLHADGTYSFPSYISKNDIEYNNIEIIDEALENKISDALRKNNYFEDKNKEKVIFNIIKWEKLNAKNRLYSVKVLFEDSFIITCGIMKGKKREWIAWPSSKDYKGKFRKNIYILNKKLNRDVEKKILDIYNKMYKK